jgi:hypothetical protein
MFAAFSVLKRYFCPEREPADAQGKELNETSSPAPEERATETEPSTPKPPPSSPIIAPVATVSYPDLPTLNPSLCRPDSDETYSV